MSQGRRAVTSLAVVCLFAITSGLYHPASSESWTRVDTDHFTIVGDGSAREVSRTAAHLERFIDMLAQTTTTPNRRQPPPTWIVLFAEEEDFMEVAVRDNRPGLAGYFLEGEDLNLITARSEGVADPLEVIIHEYVHLFLRHNVGVLPVWLEEGLAEYYSTFRPDGAKATVGTPIDNHLIELRTHQNLELSDFLRTARSSLNYHQLPAAGMFYAQSWLLTHYLFQDGGLQGRTLDKVLGSILEGRTSAEALEIALGADYSDLERTLERYTIRETFPTMVWSFDDELSARVGRARALSAAEAGIFLGELLARGREPETERARVRFETALDGARNSTAEAAETVTVEKDARLALGRLELREDNVAAAVQHFEEATRIDSLDGYGWALLGTARAEENDVEAARVAFRRAVEIDPSNSGHVLALAKTYFTDPGATWQVMDLVNSSYAEEPENLDLFEALLCLNAAVGNVHGVRQALSSRPMSKEGRQEVERRAIPLFQPKVGQLFEDGKEPEARKLIGTLREVATDASIRDWLDGLEERLGFANRQSQWVDRYNEALDLARAAHYDSAIVVWEEVARRTGSRQLRMEAKANVTRTRHIVRFDEAQNAARDGDEQRALELASLLLQDPDLAVDLRVGVVKLRDWLVEKKGSEELWARFDEATALVRRGKNAESLAILDALSKDGRLGADSVLEGRVQALRESLRESP